MGSDKCFFCLCCADAKKCLDAGRGRAEWDGGFEERLLDNECIVSAGLCIPRLGTDDVAQPQDEKVFSQAGMVTLHRETNPLTPGKSR